MYPIIRRAAVVVLLVLVVVLPGSGQSSTRTLAETTAWLQNNVGGIACIAYSMGKSPAELTTYVDGVEATFVNCEMTLDTSTTVGGAGTMGSYKVHLGKLDPARFLVTQGVEVPAGWVSQGEIPQAGIRLVTVGDEKVIDATNQPQIGSDGQGTTFKTAEIHIQVRNGNSVEPMLTAFSHAISLCKP